MNLILKPHHEAKEKRFEPEQNIKRGQSVHTSRILRELIYIGTYNEKGVELSHF